VTLATPPFRKISSGHTRTYLGSTSAKFEVHICSAILELLAFNGQKFAGHVTLASPIFQSFGSHVETFSENMRAKFEVRIFSYFAVTPYLHLTPKPKNLKSFSKKRTIFQPPD